jgi:hypothetical protein
VELGLLDETKCGSLLRLTRTTHADHQALHRLPGEGRLADRRPGGDPAEVDAGGTRRPATYFAFPPDTQRRRWNGRIDR